MAFGAFNMRSALLTMGVSIKGIIICCLLLGQIALSYRFCQRPTVKRSSEGEPIAEIVDRGGKERRISNFQHFENHVSLFNYVLNGARNI
jgi:hypothetical protein